MVSLVTMAGIVAFFTLTMARIVAMLVTIY